MCFKMSVNTGLFSEFSTRSYQKSVYNIYQCMSKNQYNIDQWAKISTTYISTWAKISTFHIISTLPKMGNLSVHFTVYLVNQYKKCIEVHISTRVWHKKAFFRSSQKIHDVVFFNEKLTYCKTNETVFNQYF